MERLRSVQLRRSESNDNPQRQTGTDDSGIIRRPQDRPGHVYGMREGSDSPPMSENNLAHIGGKHFAALIARLLVLGAALAINFSVKPRERPPSKGTPYSDFQAYKSRWAERRPSRYSVSIER